MHVKLFPEVKFFVICYLSEQEETKTLKSIGKLNINSVFWINLNSSFAVTKMELLQQAVLGFIKILVIIQIDIILADDCDNVPKFNANVRVDYRFY